MLANQTSISRSPVKVPVDLTKVKKRQNLKLLELETQPVGTRVCCTVKVLRVDDSETTSDGSTIQNVVISDASYATKIVLWNNDIGKLRKVRLTT